MPSGMHDMVGKDATIIAGELDDILAVILDGHGIGLQGRIAGTKIVEPQKQTCSLGQYPVAYTVIEGVEVAPKELGGTYRRGHGAPHVWPAARGAAVNAEGRQLFVLSGLVDGVRLGGANDSQAPCLQLLLQ